MWVSILNLQATPKNDNFKSDEYKNTINRIISGFKQINLEIETNWMKYSRINCYSCKLGIKDLNLHSFGKGTTKKQALASALGELTERFSCNLAYKLFENKYNGNGNEFTNKFDSFMNFNNLPGYEYKHSDEIIGDKLSICNLFQKYFFLTKSCYNEITNLDISKHWVIGNSLLSEKEIKVPITFIVETSGSNGLAAGNTIEEAIVQASEEIFERYSAFKIIKNKIKVPTFDIKSLKNKKLSKMIKKLEKNNIDIIIKDFSLGIFPSIGLFFINHNIKDDNTKLLQDFAKYRVRVGSAFNREQALFRCLTEQLAGYNLKNFVRGGFNIQSEFYKKFEYKEHNSSFSNFFRRYYTNTDLSFLLDGEVLDFPENTETKDFLQDINEIKKITKSLNTDLIVINHTHPILKFPTVRVIVPAVSNLIFLYDIKEKEQFMKLLTSTNSFIDFRSSEKFLISNNWLKNEEEIKELIAVIMDNFQRYLKFNFITSGMFYKEKNGLMLLASLFYKISNYEKFADCCEIISKSFSDKDYYYLSLITRRFLKTKEEEYLHFIQAKLESMKGCKRFLINKPNRNPLLTWCDKECHMNCQSKYINKFNEAVNSFYA